jgi:hypothetical protein
MKTVVASDVTPTVKENGFDTAADCTISDPLPDERIRSISLTALKGRHVPQTATFRSATDSQEERKK